MGLPRPSAPWGSSSMTVDMSNPMVARLRQVRSERLISFAHARACTSVKKSRVEGRGQVKSCRACETEASDTNSQQSY
jgi:hypothetical protein